ncbi:formate/nitrite transporter family protein [Haloarcula amylovorans]|uniref:formate/nitrite transporter family protein n=1 Tax=Haloarcula amylovorans TaxID=2562280 RepID=UPI0010762C99|nr:formate/nitrite transporter family protein [Halomicroarcula amylolytica]
MSHEEYDTTRDYQTILRLQIEEGVKELERPGHGQFLSSLSCGLTLGIGVFGLLMFTTVLGPLLGEGAVHLLRSVTYTFGFVLAIMSQTELFTEHTTLAVLPVLSGDATPRSLGQLWSLVLGGNLIGGAIFAGFIFVSGPSLHLIENQAFVDVATTFIDLAPTGVFTGAIMAGWLMALLSWILTSVGDSISRILVIIICTFPIGFGHLPHCVAGNIEVIAGMLAGADITVLQWAQFLTITTAGNIVGGVVFVALLNYSHVVWGTEGEDVAESIEAAEE